MKFYVDSCVYLNLWQNEVSGKGVKFWEIAQNFFGKVSKEKAMIIYSKAILRELKDIASPETFQKNYNDFQSKWFQETTINPEEYSRARTFESESKFTISFYDCIHITLSIKTDAILVTRDIKLIKFAEKYCKVIRPEEFI